MICQSCRVNEHSSCPEAARQADMTLSVVDRVGSAWCYCGHRPHGSGRVDSPEGDA